MVTYLKKGLLQLCMKCYGVSEKKPRQIYYVIIIHRNNGNLRDNPSIKSKYMALFKKICFFPSKGLSTCTDVIAEIFKSLLRSNAYTYFKT